MTCDSTLPSCIVLAPIHAQRGRLHHGFAFAGENALRVTVIVSVEALPGTLLAECQAAPD